MASADEGPGGPGQRFPRARRITLSREIRALFDQGRRSRTTHLDVIVSESPFAFPRAGVVVPKYKHNSVQRNLVKRRLREVLRQDVLPALERKGLPVDVLVRARREAYETDFTALRDELRSWVERECSRASSSQESDSTG